MASGGKGGKDGTEKRYLEREMKKLKAQRELLLEEERKQLEMVPAEERSRKEQSEIDKGLVEAYRVENVGKEDAGGLEQKHVYEKERVDTTRISDKVMSPAKKGTEEIGERKVETVENELFKRLNSSLMSLRRRLSNIESTRDRMYEHIDKSVGEEDKTEERSEPLKSHSVITESVLDREIADMSRRKSAIDMIRVENDLKMRESLLEKKMKEMEEQERKRKEELEMMNAIMHERELEISNREMQFKQRERQFEEMLNQRDEDMTKYKERLEEMERTMVEKFDILEKNMKKKEEDLEIREKLIVKRERETQQREESIDRKDKYEDFSVLRGKMEEVYDEKEDGIQEIDRQIRELQTKKESLGSHFRMGSEEGNCKPSFDDETRYKTKPTNIIDNINVKLNITQYSGTEPTPRNEANFEEWKMEVESVKTIYSELVVLQSIRKSLKGQAKRIMLHLGPCATVDQIINKLEDAFGNIASKDSILSHFFMAEQEESESVVEWGLRLEEMLLQASRKAAISEMEKQEMLKKRFWRGLRNEKLKDATRVHFESRIGFEELRNRVRSEEFEIKVEKERSSTKQKQTTTSKAKQYQIRTDKDEQTEKDESGDLLKQLLENMKKLDEKVEELKKENAKYRYERDKERSDRSNTYSYQRGQPWNRRPYRGGYRGRGRGDIERPQANPPESQQGQNQKQPEKKTDDLNK